MKSLHSPRTISIRGRNRVKKLHNPRTVILGEGILLSPFTTLECCIRWRNSVKSLMLAATHELKSKIKFSMCSNWCLDIFYSIYNKVVKLSAAYSYDKRPFIKLLIWIAIWLFLMFKINKRSTTINQIVSDEF